MACQPETASKVELLTGNLMISEILFGQHSTQVDASGRIAFTAEFLMDTSKDKLQDSKNVITALVIGIPR